MNLPTRGYFGWQRFLLAASLLVLAAGAGLFLSSGAAHVDAATKYTAWAGGGGKGIAVDVFVPSVLFINEGDTIEWTNPYAESHTVSFLADKPAPANTRAPVGASGSSFDGKDQLSSGMLSQGQNFSVVFPKVGTYQFVCLIHTLQTGEVQVLPAGVHVPDQKQRDYDMAQYTEAGIAKGLAAAAAVKPPVKTSNANGSSTWNIPSSPTVATKAGTFDVMQFLPSKLSIATGDTITWENDTRVPHTVSFTAGGPPGDPRAIIKPTTPTYDGLSYVTSGFMGTQPDFTGGTRFSLTFSKPGTYSYICILHASQGMAGVIEVTSNTPITPPSTGDAGLSGATTSSGLPALLAETVLLSGLAGLSWSIVRRQVASKAV